MDPAGLQLNDEKDVERDRTRGSPDFGSEEVATGEGVPVSQKKLRLRRLSSAKRCWLDAMILQDPLHGVRRDLVAEVGDSPLDSIISPMPIRFGHANDQFFDLGRDGRTSRFTERGYVHFLAMS